MSISLLHTPEGVRDIYGMEYARKKTASAKIAGVFKRYGYRSIQTPTFEFFDIFNKERGSVASREMYKFFDREGNTLVLRPDITPSIARCAAKYYMFEDMPVRLCYEGNTFINNVSYRGSLKETTILGAEMFNDTTTDADAEMVAMLIECLKESGLTEFQVEVGMVDYFNGLMEDAKLDEDQQNQLRLLIEQKNYFGVEELLAAKEMNPAVKDAILMIPKLFGGIDQIRRARTMTENERAHHALNRLEKMYAILSVYGLEKYVTFDLGMLGKFEYYTGMIFKAYTYGTGTPIATGGRYDRLLAQFGKDAPATGFGIYLDELMTALNRQKIDLDTDYVQTALLYDRRQKETAVMLANYLRQTGTDLCLMKKFYEKTLEDYVAYAKRSGIGGIFYIDETGETVRVINVEDGSEQTVRLAAILPDAQTGKEPV
ncbi:MAG: ATP phosphoribosyltransferase regulatory subunit [Lachnospiraceae bacterium]|nr:ATP phosphoribosyltransferase regulatory subunit [Lachnospiraceae bacterium]